MFKKLLVAAGIFSSCFLITPCVAMEGLNEDCGKFWNCYGRAKDGNFSGLKTFGKSFFNDSANKCIFTYFAKNGLTVSNALAYMVFRSGQQAKLVRTPDKIRNQIPQILKKVQSECAKQIQENSFDLEIYHVMPNSDGINFGNRFWNWALFSSIENGKALKEYAEFETNFRELIKEWDAFLKSDEYKQIKNADMLSEEQRIKWVYKQVTKVLQILNGEISYKEAPLARNVFSLICMLSANDGTIVQHEDTYDGTVIESIGENVKEYIDVFNNIKMFSDVACQHRNFDKEKE